jgi:uncharacterized membrane protein YphA (DoxX/SURF4 family)
VRRRLRSRRLALILRMTIGIVLVWVSLGKLLDAQNFAASLDAYELLPLAAVNFTAIVLPWLELVTGLALISGIGARGAGLVATLLAAAYVVATASVVARGLDVSCGCFGEGGHHLTWWDVALCVVLLLAAVQILVVERTLAWPAALPTRARDRGSAAPSEDPGPGDPMTGGGKP